jgi:ubiquinone/menaquinone biosynthesis C-methylase UbiE
MKTKKSGLYQLIDNKLYPLKVFILAWIDPMCWVLDKSAESILDVGCGQGLPMEMIKMRMKVKRSVGVDLFKPYIDQCKKKKIHDEYLLSDVRRLPFKNKSFDVVMALQVLEHQPKKDAWKLLEKMEKIAKKQVIVAMPIGEMYHPAVDHNELQLHLSHFHPDELEKRGYKTIKMGIRQLLGENGIVHKVNNDFLRKIIYTVSIFVDIFLFFFQPLANYYFVAYKNLDIKT